MKTISNGKKSNTNNLMESVNCVISNQVTGININNSTDIVMLNLDDSAIVQNSVDAGFSVRVIFNTKVQNIKIENSQNNYIKWRLLEAPEGETDLVITQLGDNVGIIYDTEPYCELT